MRSDVSELLQCLQVGKLLTDAVGYEGDVAAGDGPEHKVTLTFYHTSLFLCTSPENNVPTI